MAVATLCWLLATLVACAPSSPSSSLAEGRPGPTSTLDRATPADDVTATAVPATDSGPRPTLMITALERSWTVEDDPAEVATDLVPALAPYGAHILLPTPLATHPGAAVDLRLTTSQPDGDVTTLIMVTDQDRSRPLASLQSQSITSVGPSCGDRVDGNDGLAWATGPVRAGPGCTATNAAGLAFVEWIEGDSRYHVESSLAQPDLLAWLDHWTAVP